MLNSLNSICWNLFRLIGRYYMKPTVKPSISKCGLLHKLVWGQCQIFGNGQTSKYPMSTGLNYQNMQNNNNDQTFSGTIYQLGAAELTRWQ